MLRVGAPFKTDEDAANFVNALLRMPQGSKVNFTIDGAEHVGAFMGVDNTTLGAVIVYAKAADESGKVAPWRVNINDVYVMVDENAVQPQPPAEEKPVVQ